MDPAPDPLPGVRRPDCPDCGGRLGEPISGDVHCYVRCISCRSVFELDDPRLIPPVRD